MSSFGPDFTLGNFIPESFNFKDLDKDETANTLQAALESQARMINRKETGQYALEEIPCTQEYFGANPQTKRMVFRKAFAFGAIAAGANLNIAHGITGITSFTRLYGTIITNVPDDRTLPSIDVAVVTNQTSLRRVGANIVISNGATAPPITSGICVAEFVKN